MDSFRHVRKAANDEADRSNQRDSLADQTDDGEREADGNHHTEYEASSEDRNGRHRQSLSLSRRGPRVTFPHAGPGLCPTALDGSSPFARTTRSGRAADRLIRSPSLAVLG